MAERNEVAVVLWCSGNPINWGTTFHWGENPKDPKSFERINGLSIGAFFREQGVSLQQAMEVFPGNLRTSMGRDLSWPLQVEGTVTSIAHSRLEEVPDLSADGWDTPLSLNTLPTSIEGLNKLADMIDKRVYLYYHDGSTPVPERVVIVDPKIWRT